MDSVDVSNAAENVSHSSADPHDSSYDNFMD